MATTSVSSGAAMSALLQKASQQYVECRRKVTAKADEVKTLESEIQTLFARITELGESSSAKSVGRLELQIVTVEGEAPVGDAVVAVEIDPEYEEPEVSEAKEEAEVEAPKEEATADAEVDAEDKKADGEDASLKEDEDEEEKKAQVEETAEKSEVATADDAATVEEKQEPEADKAPKEKPRRSVRWDDAEGFPLKVVFDPVQSREAVVTISIAAAAKDDEESEPVKEFRIPVASLFQTGSINRWYVLKKVEHVHVDKAAVTQVADEDEPTEETSEETEKPTEEEEAEKKSEEAETTEEKKTEEADATEEKKTEDADATEEKKTEEDEKAEPAKEEAGEAKTEEEVAPQPTLVSTEAVVESEDKVVVLQEGKLHVQIHFAMSEIEKLTQTAIAIAQQKQEAEAALAMLDREALSLRTKYERLNANQRSLSAGAGVVKPRSTLLGGRGLGAAAVRVEKSTYQKVKDSVAAVLTPQRTQVITSFAIFCGSVALFHFQGDNLLA